MASILKLDTLQTPSGTGNITSPNTIVSPGAVVQIVYASFPTTQTFQTTTWTDCGGVATFIPKASGSKFKVDFFINTNASDDTDASGTSNANPYCYAKLMRNVAGGAYAIANDAYAYSFADAHHLDISPYRITSTDSSGIGMRFRTRGCYRTLIDSPSYTLGNAINYKVQVRCAATDASQWFRTCQPEGFGSDNAYGGTPMYIVITEIAQ